MKSFSPAGAATKAFYGLGARTFGNPDGNTSGNGAWTRGGGPATGFLFTQRQILPGAVPGNGAAFVTYIGAGRFLASGALPSQRVWRSTDDGTSWTENVTVFPVTVAACGWGGGDVVIVGSHVSGDVFRSTDGGLTYGAAIPAGTSVALLASDRAGRWVAVNISGPSSAVSNDDGLTWSSPGLFLPNRWLDVMWDGGQFVALVSPSGADSAIATSPDGVNWAQTLLSVSDFFITVRFNGAYIVGGSDGVVGNGIVRIAPTIAGLAVALNITPGAGLSATNVFAVAANTFYLAFADNGSIVNRSTDGGVTWEPGNTGFGPAGNQMLYAAYDPVNNVVSATGGGTSAATATLP